MGFRDRVAEARDGAVKAGAKDSILAYEQSAGLNSLTLCSIIFILYYEESFLSLANVLN
jgi:hypothetical protein